MPKPPIKKKVSGNNQRPSNQRKEIVAKIYVNLNIKNSS